MKHIAFARVSVSVCVRQVAMRMTYEQDVAGYPGMAAPDREHKDKAYQTKIEQRRNVTVCNSGGFGS